MEILENQCSVTMAYGQQCRQRAIWGSSKCILHEPDPAKDPIEFDSVVAEILREPIVDLRGDLMCDFTRVVFPSRLHSSMALEISNGASLNFNDAIFSQGVDFDGAVFVSDVDFSEATFMKTALFRGAAFEQQAYFAGANFREASSFVETKFGKWASFGKVTFGASADFAEARFGAPVHFRGSRFMEEASFDDAVFEMGAFFGGAIFKWLGSFRGTVFAKMADFSCATVEYVFRLYPNNCSLMKLNGMRIDYLVDIAMAGKFALEVADLRGNGRLSIRGSRSKRVANFASSLNFNCLRFDGKIYLENVDLTRSTFQRADLSCLRLSGVRWLERNGRQMVLLEETILRLVMPDLREIEHQYRGFKEIYKVHGNHWMAGWANYGELEMRLRRSLLEQRMRSARWRFLQRLSLAWRRLAAWEWWYKISSRFGMSFWRPIVFGLVPLTFFGLVGSLVIAFLNQEAPMDFVQAFLVRYGYDVFFLRPPQEIDGPDLKGVTDWVYKFCALGAKVGLGVLLSMAVLAVRRRFKT